MFFRRLRENSQPIAMLFAICLALTAQYLFTGEIFTHQRNSNFWEWTTNYSLALFLLVLATGFAAWAAFPREKVENERCHIPSPFDRCPEGKAHLAGCFGCELSAVHPDLYHHGRNCLGASVVAGRDCFAVDPVLVANLGQTCQKPGCKLGMDVDWAYCPGRLWSALLEINRNSLPRG